jgi:hypothetical protein
MQPPAIVTFLDEVGKLILDIVRRPVFPEVVLLGLQGFDEAFGGRVVLGFLFREMLIRRPYEEASPRSRGTGCILDSPIGVMNDPHWGVRSEIAIRRASRL